MSYIIGGWPIPLSVIPPDSLNNSATGFDPNTLCMKAMLLTLNHWALHPGLRYHCAGLSYMHGYG